MNNYFKITLFSFFISLQSFSQDWVLQFKSRIEKEDKGLAGATVTLFKGSSQISQVVTSADGNFKFVFKIVFVFFGRNSFC